MSTRFDWKSGGGAVFRNVNRRTFFLSAGLELHPYTVVCTISELSSFERLPLYTFVAKKYSPTEIYNGLSVERIILRTISILVSILS